MEHQENHKVHDQINIIVQAPIAVAFLDNQLRYVAHSAKWCTDYKLEKSDLRGLNHYDIFPEISDEWRAKHQRVLKGAEESRDEELFIREDGTEQWLKWSVKPWYYHDGKIAGIVMMTEDITSQVLIKKRDQLDFKILLDLCSHANIGTWQYNNVTRELYWSDATKELHEVADDYVPDAKQAINFYRSGESRNKISEAFLNSITRNESYDLELELVTAKGNCIWVRATGQSEFKNGLCVAQYGTFENISERKKKEHEIKVTSQKFQKLFFNSNLGVAILDTATLQFLNVNPTLE
ncbi:MAG: PAS domain S-box protein, partial [Nonlabens sp.]